MPNRTLTHSYLSSSVENLVDSWVGPDIAHAPGMAPKESSVRAIDLADIHVLVVDDYEDTLEVFGAALHRFGANVVKARNARHALTLMKTVRVNVIVSDLTMPGEDGLWLLEQIRRLKSEHGRSIPAIAVTAHRERYAVGRLIEVGFEAFLTKPVDPIDLARTVASLVGR